MTSLKDRQISKHTHTKLSVRPFSRPQRQDRVSLKKDNEIGYLN